MSECKQQHIDSDIIPLKLKVLTPSLLGVEAYLLFLLPQL